MKDKFIRLYKWVENRTGGPANMEKINYLFFGGLTTAVNYIVFFLANTLLNMERAYIFANGVAWLAAVAFAFFTNKKYVFQSKTSNNKELLREAGMFVAARLVSLLFEYGWLILAVEALSMNDYIAKLFAFIVIIALNYFFSKIFIFRRGSGQADYDAAEDFIRVGGEGAEADAGGAVDEDAELSAGNAVDEGDAWIDGATDEGDAWIDGATDEGDAWIDGATDEGDAQTDGEADEADEADAGDTNYAGDKGDAADLRPGSAADSADTGGAWLGGATYKGDAGDVQLGNAGSARLSGMSIADAAYAVSSRLRNARLGGAVGAFAGWLRRNVYALLSFFTPIALLLIAFAVIEVYPFGANSILIIDNHHQYTPFLIEFGKILREGGSLLYSWTAGLGSNYLARLAYYLSSPLNLLAVFTNDGSATEFVLTLVLIRAGAAGLAFFMYLKAKYHAQNFITVAFAVMYALCGYFLAYYWNIMWFDCIALFPLVALGLERLVDRGAGMLYCLTLAYTIMSNYFIAIMICIFSALYFIVYFTGGARSLSERGLKGWSALAFIFGRFGCFALYSLIAGALSAVITLPAYKGLLYSSAAGADLPQIARLYSNIIDIIANHLALIKPSIMVGLPNIYCGVAVLLLLPLYFINKKIAFREKVSNGLLVCFFIISFNVNTLDFLWHGTHFPNSLFFRFAFLYVFLILTMSYHALRHIDASDERELFTIFALLIGFILFMEVQPAEKTTKWTIYGSFVFALTQALTLAILIKTRRRYNAITADAGERRHNAIAAGAGERGHNAITTDAEAREAQVSYINLSEQTITYMRGGSDARAVAGAPRRRGRLVAEIALAVLICVEIAVNAGYGIGEAGIFPKQNYLMKTGDVKPMVNFVKSLESSDGSGFDRMEFTSHTTYNTPIIYGYKGISYYSSTSYVAVNEMFGKLGLIHSNAWYVYRSAPPTFNSMFAMRYLLSQEGAYDNGIYNELDITPASDAFKTNTFVTNALETNAFASNESAPNESAPNAFDNVKVYENPYYLPLGFMADESILSWNLSQSNPFLCQEDFYKRASGLNLTLFHTLEPRAIRLENMTVTSGGGADGIYRYKPTDENRAVRAEYRVTARRDGPIYFYVKCPNIETVRVMNITAAGRDIGGGSDGGGSSTGGGGDNGGAAPAGISREHNIKYPYVIDAQFAKAGDEVSIELIFTKPDADSFTLYARDFDAQAFGAMWNRLSAQGLEVTGYTDSSLTGAINVYAPGLLYTSIPYDEGWRVEVNGKPAIVETVGNGALIAVRLPAGRNTLSFHYMTPGLIPGAVITLCAALLLAGISLYRYYIPNMRSFKSR